MFGIKNILCAMLLSTGAAVSALGQVQTANWGGDMVSANRNFRNGLITRTNADLDGDGAVDDSIAEYPYSDTIPLNPSANYNGRRFYGGIRGEVLNQINTTFQEANVQNSSSGDIFNVRFQTTTTGQFGKFWSLMYLDKADFLNGGATLPVQFDRSSRLEYVSARFENLGAIRWVVRNGSSFYVSQNTFSGNSIVTFSSDDNDGNWAPYAPSASLDFNQASAVFAPQNFTNITAIGILSDKDTSSTVRHWIQFRSINVLAQVGAKPSVSIISPANGAVLPGPADVTLEVNASDDGAISNVQFFSGSTVIGTASSQPYNLLWNGVQPGTYTIKAKAADNLGQTSESSPVSLIINLAPEVSLNSPAPGSVFGAGQNITVAASASDIIGGVASVEFFAGNDSLGSVTSSPYQLTWGNVPSGIYSLSAVARDVFGFATTSSVVQVTVTLPPQVDLTSPADSSLFVEPASIHIVADASDPDGSISKVDFYSGSTLLGSSDSSPFALTWSQVLSGDYTLHAVAIDNLNFSASSAPVAVKVNSAPAVAIWNLSNNMSFAPPADIVILAEASDKDGTISNINFFAGSTLVGVDSTSPYGILWTQVESGSYDLVARATDNLGTTGESSTISVDVTLPDGALPAPWRASDIGEVAASGSSSHSSGIFTLKGAGSSNNLVAAFKKDAVHYAYWGLIGDGEIKARVLAIHGLSPLAKAGVMIRADLSDVCAYAELSLRPVHPHHASAHQPNENYDSQGGDSGDSEVLAANGWLPDHVLAWFQARRIITTQDGSIPVPVLRSGGIQATPQWLKLQRIGNIVKSYRSLDGVNWVHVHSQAMTLGSRAYIGLAVTSRSGDKLSCAQFDNVTVAAVEPNDPPAVSLISPEEATVYDLPATVPLEAEAADADVNDSIESVEFYVGTQLIAVDNISPFQASWQADGAGWRYFTARARDYVGNYATAGPVQVLFNSVPEVSLTAPAGGAIFTAPANVALSADAADADGQVAYVEFYSGASLIGTDLEPPYSVNWNNAPAGVYELTAVAHDDQDGTGVASPVTITINAPPQVSIISPSTGTVYQDPASISVEATALDADGTVEIVDFYSGTTQLASALSSPFLILWDNVPKGSYQLTARATDNLGAATDSVSVNVVVKGLCGSPGAGPMDNPIAARYGADAYAWTDEMKWDCVHNIHDYAGATMVDQFNAARDAAASEEGGVVYFPSGSYAFEDSIFLKNGVVIRGATPSMGDAKQSGYLPPSKLEFPKYVPSLSGSGTPKSTAFKYISTLNTNMDSNIGVVNVDLNRVFIKIVASDAATQANRNILIFGVRNNNAADPGGAYGGTAIPTSWQHPWQRWPNRAMPNIKINAYQNILVANNRLNDISQTGTDDSFDQPGYLIKNGNIIEAITDGSRARFDYADHTGLNINRADDTGYVVSGTPATEPMLFRTGVVIRDNWIYQTLWSAMHAAGQGLVVKDNVKVDRHGKVKWVDPTGQRMPHNSATFENRGLDWSGYDVLVEGNDYTVTRNRINEGPYFSIDGEGILLQACCGGTLANGATIRNNIGNAYIGLWKTRDINNVLIENNTVNNGTGEELGVYVDANVAARTSLFRLHEVRVRGNTTPNGISMWGDIPGGTGNVVENNVSPGGSGTIDHSCNANVTISGNTGFTINACRAQ